MLHHKTEVGNDPASPATSAIQSEPEVQRISTHNSTIQVNTVDPKPEMLNMTTVAFYVALAVGIATLCGMAMKFLADRRKDDREWFSNKMDAVSERLGYDIAENKTDLKEFQRRLHDVEQHRASDREKIVTLEKDMGFLKEGQGRIEKMLEKQADDQKAYFGEMAESIREMSVRRPKD